MRHTFVNVPVFKISRYLFILAGLCSAPAAERPVLRDFIGLNVHTVQFKPERYLEVTRLVRDYHPVHWDLAEDTPTLPDFPVSKNKVDWEALYGSWVKKGIDIDACLMFESIPRDHWTDIRADATAYGKAFAREFGPTGARRLVNTVEIGNEPGKWSDEDFRTLFRAMAQGIREGDPKMKIATCNLRVGPSRSYDKSVDCLKDDLGLVDILCVHTYPMVELYPTWRRSYPEDPKLLDYFQLVEELCQWRDKHAPGKPVWITEFGYDSTTQPQLTSGDFAKWEDVTDDQHAQWLVRSILLFSAMPVDRAYIYFFDDNDEPTFHASSGLTRRGQPKPAFHAVAQLQRLLGDFRFAQTLKIEGQKILVHEYVSAEDPRLVAWVAWSPTGDGQEKKWEIKIPPGRLVASERMTLDASQPVKAVASDKAPLQVSVTESPLYLIFEKPAPQASR